MERMANGSGDQLDALWSEYRAACPDPEAGPNFVPQLWQKIEARRRATTSLFRRWAEVCVMAALTVTVLVTTFLVPRIQRLPVYEATYVDVLAAADSIEDFLVPPSTLEFQ